MANCTEKRSVDSKALADKGGLKADAEDKLVMEQVEHVKKLEATK